MGTGGTRYGAGRPGYRLKAEQCQRIDIRLWHKSNHLRDSLTFTTSWNRGGEKSGSINVAVSTGNIRLIYSIRANGEQWRDASQTITTTTTPCHYGGARPWFCCPACHDRAAVLYMRSGRFACRHCQRISYSSQSGSAIDRICNRFHKLDAVVMAGKPKWQRWATRDRLLARYDKADEQFNAVLGGRLKAMGCPELLG